MGMSFVHTFTNLFLENSKIWDIEFNYDANWVFFATDNGILAYDGNLCDLYALNNATEVRSVSFDDKNRKLYVGGINEFGFLEPGDSGVLQYNCLSDSIGTMKDVGNIWGIHARDNTLFVQGDHNIIVYPLDNPRKSTIIGSDTKINGSSLVNDVLYLATEDGLKTFSGNAIKDFGNTALPAHSRIRAVLSGPHGPIIVTANDGVYTYSYGKFHKLECDAPIEGEIFSSAVQGNKLALGSIGRGVYIVDTATGSVDNYDERNGLLSNTVLSLEFDRHGNLWIGHDGEIEQLVLNSPLKTLSNIKLPIGHGYVSKIFGNRLWLGTNRGLYSTPLPLAYPVAYTKLPSIEGQTWGLKVIDDILYLCHDHGLFEIKGPEVFKRIGNFGGVWDVRPLVGDESKLLLACYEGFYVLDKKGREDREAVRVEGYFGSPYNFVQQNDSTVWVSEGEKGIEKLIVDFERGLLKNINYYSTASDGTSLSSNTYISEMDGRPVFLSENGVYAYDAGKDIPVPAPDFVASDKFKRQYLRLRQTDSHTYVMAGNQLIRTDNTTRRTEVLPLWNDCRISRHYGNIMEMADDSTIILPTRKGYAFARFGNDMIDVDGELGLNPHTINQVIVSNESGDSLVYRSNYLDTRPVIKLPYKNNSVRIIFGDENLAKNGLVRYRYKLNGEHWSEETPLTIKEYTNLDEGDYVFTLESIYFDGTTRQDSVGFTINPPWYRTKAVYIADLLLILGLIAAIALFIRHRVKRREKDFLREQENELLHQKSEYQRKEQAKNEQIARLEREKLQQDYNRKTQELTNFLISEASKNEILIDIKEELRSFAGASTLTRDQKKSLSAINGKIDVSLHTDKVLERVEKEFNLLHNDFTQQLRRQFPTLSNSEIMLCSYIKMNLSTKEIAPLLNISVRGVETMRYRLRKKLNLDRDDSLSGFIANFS